MPYVAIVNIPGYLPQADEPATFDTASDAWEYLTDERKRAEDEFPTDGPSSYSDTVLCMEHMSRGESFTCEYGRNHHPEATGTIYGRTPGSEADDESPGDARYDLGYAYSVEWAEPWEVTAPGSYGIEAVDPATPGAIVCGECGLAWTKDITPAGRCPWEYDHDGDDDA